MILKYRGGFFGIKYDDRRESKKRVCGLRRQQVTSSKSCDVDIRMRGSSLFTAVTLSYFRFGQAPWLVSRSETLACFRHEEALNARRH